MTTSPSAAGLTTPVGPRLGASLDVTHHRLTANGLVQHYVTAGQGPPVVLLHGFPEFWYAWRHQIPVLAQSYTVIAPDRSRFSQHRRGVPGGEPSRLPDC